jgi:hypothetical protein
MFERRGRKTPWIKLLKTCQPSVSRSERPASRPLVEKNITLRKEIEVLEKRRAARWKEMVENNTWVDHEEDLEVKAIDRELEEKSSKKVKVWSVIRDRNRLIEAGLDPGPEDHDLSSSSSDESSSDDEADANPKVIDDSRESSSVPPKRVDEEYDHLILLMTKKDKLYAKFSLENEMTDWEGPFDINTPVEELRKLAEIVHPVIQQQGNESSTNREVGA